MIKSLILVSFLALFSSSLMAEVPTTYGLQCSGVSSNDLRNCLNRESDKIDEANLPNEIIISLDSSGNESLVKMVEEYAANKNSPYALSLLAKLTMIKSAIASALIIQYEDEPQLYYYVVDQDGKLEVIFDGLNSVDISTNFPAIFLNEPEVFSLKAPNVSKEFKSWIKYLKGEE